MRKTKKSTKKEVKRALTLSKYNLEVHHFEDDGEGRPRFYESLNPINQMLEELYYAKKVKLGSTIEVSMKVKR
jgi:hypothetical protein